MVQSVFQNRCVGIVALRTLSGQTPVGTTLYAQTGSGERDARINAVAVCGDIRRVYGGICEIQTIVCEDSAGDYDTWLTAKFHAVRLWWSNTNNDVKTWWNDNVTTTILIVSATFLVLAAALLYTTIQLRKLKRVIAPPVKSAIGPWWLFGAFSGSARKASRKMKEPLKGAALDERTIREAFGTETKRREEFEL